MPSCIINSCSNNRRNKNYDEEHWPRVRPLSFHRFPKNKKLLDKWVEVCGLDPNSKFLNDRICSDHFREEDYEIDLKSQLLNCKPRTHLKPNAIPFVEDWRVNLQKKDHGRGDNHRRPINVGLGLEADKVNISLEAAHLTVNDEIKSLEIPHCNENNGLEMSVSNGEKIVTSCFVCDRRLKPDDVGNFPLKEVVQIIQKILEAVSSNHVVVLRTEDKLCQNCCHLMCRISRLEEELRSANLALRALLRLKYSLDVMGAPAVVQPPRLVVPLAMDVTHQERSRQKKHKTTQTDEKTPVLKYRTTQTDEKTPVLKHRTTQTPKLSKSLQRRYWDPVEIQTQEEQEIFSKVPNSTLENDNPSDCVGVSSKKDTDADGQKKLDNLVTSFLNTEEEVDYDSEDTISIEEPLEEINVYERPLSEQMEEFSVFVDEIEVGEDDMVLNREDRPISDDEPRVLICSMCSYTTDSIKTMKSHFNDYKYKEGYYCCICDFSFHRKISLKAHMAKHSRKRQTILFCSFCRKPIRDRLQHSYHNKLMHKKPALYVCPFCLRVFRFEREMRRHLGTSHNVIINLSCEKCGGKFKDRRNLKKHLEYGHRQSLTCLYCDKPFKKLNALIQHEYVKHKQIRKYKCKFCPKSFSRKERLPEHEKQHTETFEFRCDKCNYGCHEEALLKKHKSRHKPKKKYYYPRKVGPARRWMCDICGKVIVKYQSFKIHRELHENPAPFQCQTCFKKFRWKENMNTHIRRFHPNVKMKQPRKRKKKNSSVENQEEEQSVENRELDSTGQEKGTSCDQIDNIEDLEIQFIPEEMEFVEVDSELLFNN